MSDWKPKRTLAEVKAILCPPGSPLEIETRLVDGRLFRVYKNLWPSLRAFWLLAAKDHADKIYVVFEKRRYTYRQVFERSVKAAAVYRDVYGVRKGDRVAICARNYPDFLVAFWACHLIGAVSVLVNASVPNFEFSGDFPGLIIRDSWLPLNLLYHCLAHTQCKLIVLDSERADCLEPVVSKLIVNAGTVGFLVLEAHEGKGRWGGMQSWDYAMDNYKGNSQTVLTDDPGMVPEDNACILFTSGTTGLPKGVLSTQRQWLTNVLTMVASARRSALRRGEDIPTPASEPQKCMLIPIPLFHVAGSASLNMLATMGGLKIVFMRKWDVLEATRLIKEERVTLAGGVPSMAFDLTESEIAGYPLEGFSFGGSTPPGGLHARAQRAFPDAVIAQAYGMTETSGVVVNIGGEDCIARPDTCGLASPVNDVVIMDGDKEAATGSVGEVWIRGPSIMKEYWRDQAATEKALTKDGWLKSGDLGYLDDEGFLYIRGRSKDVIVRGGENIDSVSVENALHSDPRVVEAAAVGIPHLRLGEQVAAVVSIRPENRGQVTEEGLIALVQKILPKFAVPVMVLILDQPFEQTASGKMLKTELRKLASVEWEKRQSKVSSKL